MSKVQLYAKTPEGETVLLQLSDDSPVKVTMSVAEINPFTPSSFYSQTFRLPSLGPNAQFFKDAFSVNGTTFNPAAAAEAWILNDGFLFCVGNINLQAVYSNDRTGLIEYEIYFLGDTSNLSTSIGEGGMNTIDASDLDHELTYTNVTASWAATGGATAGLKNGNVLYPLCEWGYTYGTGGADQNLPQQPTASHGYPKSFTIGTTAAMWLNQMKPAIRIKWLFDKILSDAGYTYDSTFLNSDLFQSLYYISDSSARAYFPAAAGICEITGTDFSIPLGSTQIIPLDNAIQNFGSPFNTDTSTWTAPVTGTYQLQWAGTCEVFPEGGGIPPSAAFRVKLYKNGTFFDQSQLYTTRTTNTRVGWIYNYTSSITKGETFQMRIEHMSFSTKFAVFLENSFACQTGPNEVVMTSFLPDDTIMKKIDFIRSVMRMFNLVFEPSRVSQKKFVIEPWVDWVQQGGIQDWTKYYEGAKDTKSSAVFFDQQRNLKFKAAEDEDWLNKTWQDQYKTDYMYRQYDSTIKLIKGDQEIDLQFAPTPLQSIASRTTAYPNWVFPSLGRIQAGDATEHRSGQMQPITPKPRILFYNGLQSNPVNWYLSQIANGASGPAQSNYPLVSPYSSWPPSQFTTLNLNFQSKPALWSPSSTYIAQTSTDLYTAYWKDFVDWIYDPYNRKVDLTVRLSPAQIQDFNFNDRIWIKDTWYFVQKIKDYAVGDTDLLDLECVKVPGIAIPGPIPTPATGGTAGTTCQKVNLCNNNPIEDGESTYTYVDCSNNLASITLYASSCGEEVCMLYPPINPLPSGWTYLDAGSCGSTGTFLTLNVGITGAVGSELTTVTIYSATGGTAGTYVAINNLTVSGQQNFIYDQEIPNNYGVKVGLSSTKTPGAAISSESIVLNINGVTGPTASRSGTYQPIDATFLSTFTPGNTYTATVNFIY